MNNEQLTNLNRNRNICQIGIVTRDLQKSIKNWINNLNIGPWQVCTFSNETATNFIVHGEPVTEPFKFLVAYAHVGNTQFEIIQPVYGPSIYDKFLKEKGEGLHHVKEFVDHEDVDRVLAEYQRKGIAVTQSGQFENRAHYYLGTEPLLGVIYELGVQQSGDAMR